MIPFNNFTREYKSVKADIDSAVYRVLKRGWFVLGPEVAIFEKTFAKYIGAKYCVGVNSATDALYLSLVCAGIGKGDEVIVPVNTAIPTATAVIMSGATPVFVDCDESFLIDVLKIEKAITKKTRAIIPVHLYGKACDMNKLKKLAKSRKLMLIEDCAQSAGAEWDGKKVGSFGDFSAFSFYPTKNIGAYGDGGAILTNDITRYKKLLAMRFYGQAEKNISSVFGVNSRLDEIQAAILRAKLKYLDRWNKKRQHIAELYRRLITNPKVILPPEEIGDGHVYHLFVVRVKNREDVIEQLQKHGIQALVHYPMMLARQPFFKRHAKGVFPRAGKFESEILSLPMHPFLEKHEIKKIADVINSI
ncbi:MAG: erythromycin biosynthesis sensory transduction protein eryC1 [Candidatus Lloydbacteria bacterium CG22_combo_CG10-13_8_21_14_all_47_15]|uniref:Erythromycin biosynthesis sensory transduction protein eryC1 n=1 Tax=Candidatus Lloydbacteria bacterium CG22_combo_CG10-13_8_21_14_all_47_15 TaxID=1974635 RepID=A0A2H0CV58_9BACT|nr:MAG: erythromycin biosynthesis sensory transduction protein eryC1 [Candidatus Lloydbacteria bacterium CG22_combo_CG10-13_8_21_14_all_47_15]